MKHITVLAAVGLCLMAGLAEAQTTAGGRGQRPPQTPEQQAAAARREAEQNAPRPIDALDSVWMEDLTWMEVRDAIKGGKSTALILTGGVESSGPHLATGKHNFILKVMTIGRITWLFPGNNCPYQTLANFSNGVTIAAGVNTVPAGVTSFTVSVPTTSDTIDEANETYTLTVGAASGTGTITDDDAAQTISSVSSASALEAASIVHTVTLSNASSVATTYALSLADMTATGGSTDYTSTLINANFSNGVTIAAGVITVPAGVTSFTVSVPTTSDTIDEANEAYTLTVGSASGTGTITDDDAAPTISSVSSASALEATNLVHTVTLTNASTSATTFAYTLAGGTATGGGTDYTTPPTFSNGVTLPAGVLTVPAGVTSFTVTVPTTLDTIDEGASETYDLTVGGVTGVGTITDDDAAPTISSVSSASALEATSMVHTVTLSNASSVATTYALSLADVTATGGGTDYTSRLINANFSNGVTIAAGVITVPAGVTSFTVSVPTTSDTIDEANETYTLTVGSASGTGTITDDDAAPTIASVTADTQLEGTNLVHTVTLTNASSSATAFAYDDRSRTSSGGYCNRQHQRRTSVPAALPPGTYTASSRRRGATRPSRARS